MLSAVKFVVSAIVYYRPTHEVCSVNSSSYFINTFCKWSNVMFVYTSRQLCTSVFIYSTNTIGNSLFFRVCKVFIVVMISSGIAVLLYVLLCLTNMYCTLYILYILQTVHTAHVSQFPTFPCLSDVENSSSTSVHACSHFHKHSRVHIHIT